MIPHRKDGQLTPSDFGIYIVKANTIYNGTNEDQYALYPHNVLRKLEKYGGKFYCPFVFRGKLVVLKGNKLYPK